METEDALQLIEKTISEFERIRQFRKVKYLDGDFFTAYETMMLLLNEFLSPDEMHKVWLLLDISSKTILNKDHDSILAFGEHCTNCITQLRICEIKIRHFSREFDNNKDNIIFLPQSNISLEMKNKIVERKSAIQLIDKYIALFEKAKGLPAPGANPNYDGAIFGTVSLLKEIFDNNEAINFLERITPTGDLIKGNSDLEFVAFYFHRHVDTCIALLDGYKDRIQHFLPSAEMGGRIIPSTDKVFIVHGHDEPNLLRIRTLIKDRYGLNPIVLAEKPSKGRTIIEKFEDEATHAAFAFAIVTSDDLVQAKTGEYLQARPNVAFEIGWFYGRLGRERVCILLKEGTRIHSDLDGISRIQFKTSIEEKIGEIDSELLAAGLIKGILY